MAYRQITLLTNPTGSCFVSYLSLGDFDNLPRPGTGSAIPNENFFSIPAKEKNSNQSLINFKTNARNINVKVVRTAKIYSKILLSEENT